MNLDIKMRWCDTLRSKEYKQGFHVLRRDDSYCALGVLVDLFDKTSDEKHKARWTVHHLFGGKTYRYGGHTGAIPICVMEWANISFSDQSHVARLNDEMKESFEAIADYIEVNL